ncbi:MAG: hypothetical protein ACLQU3_22460 [Limisphaerales bacterium]
MRATVVVVLLGGLLGCSRETPAPRVATVYRLKEIAYTLEVLRKEKPEALSLLVPGANDGKEDRLRQFLMREKASLQPVQENDIIKLVTDGWGHPFNLACRADVAMKDRASPLLRFPGDVLVWSSGPDGTNQFGRGDDVVYTPAQ